MTKQIEALKLARTALGVQLDALLGKAGHLRNDDRRRYAENGIKAIDEALAQPEPWEKFCDSNCVWTDHHPDCKLAQQEPVAYLCENAVGHKYFRWKKPSSIYKPIALYTRGQA